MPKIMVSYLLQIDHAEGVSLILDHFSSLRTLDHLELITKT